MSLIALEFSYLHDVKVPGKRSPLFSIKVVLDVTKKNLLKKTMKLHWRMKSQTKSRKRILHERPSL
ncbi:hypothetical protein YC2023_086709 [Brassica napus]